VATRGPSRYFGGDDALAAKVTATVEGVTGASCRVGVADGPFAAELAARRGVIVPRGASRAFLAGFPVSSLERSGPVAAPAAAGAMAERVRWQLDGWITAGTTTAALTLLRLAADEVAPDDGRQLGFWGGEAVADERAGRALARVQGMLGPHAVVTAVVGGGRSPAEQVRLV